MKTKTVCKLVSLVLATAVTQTSVAADRSGGSHSFGGGHSFGAARPASRTGGFAGARFAFGTRPSYGRPVYVQPRNSVARAAVRTPAYSRPTDSSASTANRTAPASRSVAASPRIERAGTHVYARQDGTWHGDWDRRSAHFWKGHWWAWDGGYWIGLDEGFYPWDYFPYYAYDYYPYDYYPGYYADVQPYYNNDGVYDGLPAPDPNVTAVQTDLTKFGYYQGPVDGLYGQATRDAVARYQSDHQLAVTGTLTTQTLQSLGVSPAVSG